MFTNNPKTRLAIYILGMASQVASFFVSTFAPEIAEAFSKTADALTAIAVGTAVAYIPAAPKVEVYEEEPDEVVESEEVQIDDTDSILEDDAPVDGATPTAGPDARHAEV